MKNNAFNAKKSRKVIDCLKNLLYLRHRIRNKRELLTNDNVLSIYEPYHANVDDDDHIHHDDPSGLG